jgi:O-antigen/teichoic acid export membrane protein
MARLLVESVMIWNRTTANVIANAMVAVVNGLVGILTISFLTRQFGADKYGVWVLIGLVAGYLVVLDFGLIAATGRRLAARLAVGDRHAVSRIVATHLASSLALSIFIAGAALAVAVLFPRIFLVPSNLQRDAFFGVLLAGASVSAYFLFSVFSCLLWAKERFDIVAAIDIPIQLAKAAAIFLWIDEHSSLAQLAFITLPGNVISGVLTFAACIGIGAMPKLSWRNFSLTEFRHNRTLGVQLFTHQFVRTVSFLSGASIVGNRLEPDDVTSYSLARFLTNYAHTFVIATSQAAATKAVRFHSGGEHDEQRNLLLIGGRYAASCALLFLGGFITVGAPFIELWQGGRHPEVFVLLLVLAAGETVSMSQAVTNSILLGMNRQAALIKLIVCEIVVTVALGVALASVLGTIGACIAIALSLFLIRGGGQIWLGCRALNVSISTYFLRALAPGLVPALPAIAAAHVMGSILKPETWIGVLAVSLVYIAIFAIIFLFITHRRQNNK